MNRTILPFIIYIGAGAGLYAAFGGTGGQFQFDNAWLYGWVLAWPLMIIIHGYLWIIGIIITIVALFFILSWIVESNWYRRWQANRSLSRMSKAQERTK